jgi:hypothetical protein
MRISLKHPADLFVLAGAEHLPGIQAPDSFQQTLPPQDFMQASDASGEVVRGVKKCGVAVCYFGAPLE